MLVSSNYYPKDTFSKCSKLKDRDTYTEDLYVLSHPLELLSDFFELLSKTDDYDDIVFVGKALVEHASIRTEEYIKVLEHEFGDVCFICAKHDNTENIPSGALVKVEIAKKKTVAT